MDILFFFEEVDPIEFDFETIQNWVHQVIRHHNKEPREISLIFCSDDFILNLNKKYLNHDYFTDILTFNYSKGVFISGDLFISIDTVRSNAVSFNIEFEDELYRVIVHGILHLLGFDDTSLEQREEMTKLENFWLKELKSN